MDSVVSKIQYKNIKFVSRYNGKTASLKRYIFIYIFRYIIIQKNVEYIVEL